MQRIKKFINMAIIQNHGIGATRLSFSLNAKPKETNYIFAQGYEWSSVPALGFSGCLSGWQARALTLNSLTICSVCGACIYMCVKISMYWLCNADNRINLFASAWAFPAVQSVIISTSMILWVSDIEATGCSAIIIIRCVNTSYSVTCTFMQWLYQIFLHCLQKIFTCSDYFSLKTP